MKKLFVLLFAVLTTATISAQFSGSGSGTQNDPYLIFNPIHLDQMRNFLGQSGVYFKLMADIDLEEFIADNYGSQGWLPIGGSSSVFNGNLDGNGKKITNLTINRPSTTYVGFFGRILGATISNLTIEGTISGGNYSGIVIGAVGLTSTSVTSSSYISNVTVKGSVTGGNYAGGLAGFLNSGKVSDVTVIGSIIGNDYAGGLAGYSSNGTVSNCFAQATVKGTNYVGGLIGQANYSNVTDSSAKVKIESTDYCGGIVGDATIQSGSNNCTIGRCHVSGNIMANDYIGGIVGNLEGLLSKKTNSSSISYYIASDCHFHGTVVGRNNVGGVCGSNNRYSKVLTNYSVATITGQDYVGGIIGSLGSSSSSTIQQNVAINHSVSGNSNVGRIAGTTSGTFGAIGTSKANKALNTTKVSLNGIEQTCEDNNQHGQGVGNSVLKYAATYQGIGWDFSSTWDIQETESYPYFTWQTAPPIINDAASDETTVSGKGTNNTVISITVDGKNYQTTCTNNVWSVTTEPLVAGSVIYATAGEGRSSSYTVSTTVAYKGKGTEAEPYQIYTAQELANIHGNGYYKLMNDIDISSINPWKPIGQYETVTAHLDGNHHTVSGLNINTTDDYQGLFGKCYGSTLKNINLSVSTLNGGNYTGALVAKIIGGEITDCHITGDVTGTDYTGGLAGLAQTTAISQCSVKGDVTGTTHVGGITSSVSAPLTKTEYNGVVSSTSSSAMIGGLTGENSGAISECKTNGNVTASGTSSYAGGLVGKNNSEGTITNCYSVADVTAVLNAGGIVGRNFGKVEKCYASGNIASTGTTKTSAAAGVVGYNDGSAATVSNCYAMNPTISVSAASGVAIRIIGGIANSAPTPEMNNYAQKTMVVSVNGVPQTIYDDNLNGTAKTEEQLKSQETYLVTGWDMTSVWGIEEGSTYPLLRHFIKYATIKFVNYDGTELQSGSVMYGTLPSYKGQTPAKPQDTQYSYTFEGWNPALTEVTGDATYTAKYTNTLREYTVTFLDENGGLISSQKYKYGQTPAAPADPEKPSTDEYDFTFSGWTPAIASVTGDATYTATYSSSVIEYFIVTFKDEDGTTLDSRKWKYGATPTCTEPTKDANAQYTYTFAGWDKTIAAVTGNATYTATYSSTLNQYTVIFKDEDGTVLDSRKWNYGATPTCTEPTKQADKQYTYTFAGWDKTVAAVTGNATYTATYSSTLNQYTVIFKDEDGTVLDSRKWNYGATPTCTEPTKAANTQYTYTFAGWDKTVAVVTGNATYTATYSSTLNQYTVIFKDEDGTVLDSRKWNYGATPTCTEPTKAANTQYTYTFAGWDKTVAAVTDNATYTATYSSTLNQYTVTFKNEDGTVLDSRKWNYGATPTCTDPTKAADVQYTYTFAGWDKTVAAVTGNATYTATYSSTLNQYTVTFKDEDGTVLDSRKWNYGATPTCTEPTKPADAQYTYIFAGWNKAVVAVTGDATYKATYTTTSNQYTVVFYDEDGIKVLQSSKFNYGELPSYTGVTPVKAGNAQYTYTFAGWDKTIVTVTGNASYKATYTQTVNKYLIIFKNEDGMELKREEVKYGTMPVAPANAEKASTAQYDYTFDQWSPSIAAVTQAATYYATYTATVREYTVTFKNDEGGVISIRDYKYGEMPIAPADPSKTSTAEYSYSFVGWDKVIAKVEGPQTYQAVFNATKNKYIVIFRNDNGSELKREEVEYGAMPVAPATPTKSATAEYTYVFSGWSPAIAAVTDNAVYVASFTGVLNKYVVTFVLKDDPTKNYTVNDVPYGTQVSALVGQVKTALGGETWEDDTYVYSFAGLEGVTATDIVTGDATYVVLYTREEKTPTTLENVSQVEPVTKIVRNGHVFILRGGKIYTLQGQEVR